jgi:hypothetical protein
MGWEKALKAMAVAVKNPTDLVVAQAEDVRNVGFNKRLSSPDEN